MGDWPDRRALDLFGISHPIIQAPMAGNTTPELVIAVCEAGGLGSLACAQYHLQQARDALTAVRAKTKRPINVNFFCHTPPVPDPVAMLRWRTALAPYYVALGLDPSVAPPAGGRSPFDADFCGLVEAFRPEVVSFHFGLPPQALFDRVKATGAKMIASATTVAEARFLEAHGCDAVIAMGTEAGGHRGNFLNNDITRQAGLFALLPQVVDAVNVPVIAAGGISDSRGVVAALALGASAVQIGTAYLFTPEAKVPAVHRAALQAATDDATAITDVFTGRPARGIVNRLMRELGPMSQLVPEFPLAGGALAPLRAKTEPDGLGDFINLWSGQAAALAKEMPAGALTLELARGALARMAALSSKLH